MNIFILDQDPKNAATMLCDKHITKMLVETAQLLCVPFHLQNVSGVPYKLTHQHHPCSKWVCESRANFDWLMTYAYSLIDEYTFRYSKHHASTSTIEWCQDHVNDLTFEVSGLTPFAQAMPEHYRDPNNAVNAYRSYYLGEKKDFAKWNKARAEPDWWKEHSECDDMVIKDNEIQIVKKLSKDLELTIDKEILDELNSTNEENVNKHIDIQIKKLYNDALLPTYATAGSAGADVYSNHDFVLKPGDVALIHTGFAMSLPPTHEAQIRPRSGMALKHGITVLNAPGTIDSDYRDEVKVLLTNMSRLPFHGRKGMRIAQMVISEVPKAKFIEVSSLEDTSRKGGFGSTGA